MDEKKNKKKIELILHFNGYFLTYMKTVRFAVPLIVLVKWEVFNGLQIHPKKVLRILDKACKERKTRSH